jgi:hypothetical protein
MPEQKKTITPEKENLYNPKQTTRPVGDPVRADFFTTINSRISYLKINKPAVKLDDLAFDTLNQMADSVKYKKALDDVLKVIKKDALTAYIAEVTKRLNRTSMDPVNRLLLSKESIYGYLLLYAVKEEKIKGSDVEGIYHSVLRNLNEFQLDLINVPEDELKYK